MLFPLHVIDPQLFTFFLTARSQKALHELWLWSIKKCFILKIKKIEIISS